MKKKVLAVLIGLTLVLTMVFGLLPGCKATPETPTTPGETPTTPGETPTAVKPVPTGEGETFTWRCQSVGSAGSSYWPWLLRVVEDVTLLSQGRLTIEMLPVGSIVGTMEVFDAVSSGAVESGTSCDPYWAGLDPRFDIQGMISAHFTFDEALIWFGDDPAIPGRELTDKLYEEFGVKWLPIHLAPTESEYVSNKVILNPGDYKGLTFRGTGWTGMVMNTEDFGAAGVMMPSGDVYSSLERGVIDACELGNPYSNWLRGLHEVTEYVGFPGIHKLTETNSFIVNMDQWNKLDPYLQKVVEVSTERMITQRFETETYQSAMTLFDLDDFGCKIVYESPALQEEWRRVSWGLAEEMAVDNAEFKEMWDAMKDFTAIVRPYMQLQTPSWGVGEEAYPWPVIMAD